MHYILLLLLMVMCLAYTTNCVVYYVVPDNHYLATNNNTLQHYLNNSEKYFTSHTQLVFLPGSHHLHTDLVVQNISNFTLEGIGQKEMPYTMIYCTESAQVVINNSHNINLRYLIVSECGVSKVKDLMLPLAALDIFNCSNVILLNSLIVCQYQQCGLEVINVVGDNFLYNITSSYLLIIHNMTRDDSRMESVTTIM